MKAIRALGSESASRFQTAWSDGGPRQRAVLTVAFLAAAALVGAFLFGAWHVVVGGLVKGNWRAGAFGAVLALVAGALLWIELALVGRSMPGQGRRRFRGSAAVLGDGSRPRAEQPDGVDAGV